MSGPPPTGIVAEARQQAQLPIGASPLVASVAQNPAGPVPVAPANDDALANSQGQYQLCLLHKNSLKLQAQLDRIRDRFMPSEMDLATILSHPVVGSASRLDMLVQAFMFYWAGMDAAAVLLALPRLESLLREIERGRSVPVVAVAKGVTPGGVSQLGALISLMPDAGFDEDWQYFFSLLLTDGQRGLNLRNELSHGIGDCPPRPQVALVLQATIFLLAVAHEVVTLAKTVSDEDCQTRPVSASTL